jgi:hypothetical protein
VPFPREIVCMAASAAKNRTAVCILATLAHNRVGQPNFSFGNPLELASLAVSAINWNYLVGID